MGICASAVCLIPQALCMGFSCVKCCCTGAMGASGIKAWQAKVYYVFLLAIGTLFGFLLGQIGEEKAEDDDTLLDIGIFGLTIDCADITGEGNICSGDPAILRASFASVLFFAIMLLGTIPVPTFKGERSWRPLLGEGFHRGFWGVKFLLYFALLIGSFFMGFFDEAAFTGVARFVSMIFLILQVLILIDFAYTWDETWVERSDVENDFADGSKCWLIVLLGIAGLLYIAAYGGLIAILVLFKGCSATVGIAATTLTISLVSVILTLLKDKFIDDEVSGSIVPPAVVSAYMAYLSFSASQSNPSEAVECNPFEIELGEGGGDLFLSLVFSVVTLLWTAVSVSGNSEALLGGKKDRGGHADLGGAYEIEDENGNVKFAREVDPGTIPGGDDNSDGGSSDDRLWFFHAIMLAASFHFSMVLTNFGVSEQIIAEEGGQAGNITLAVKGTAAIAAGVLFVWTIIAPAVLPDREW